MKNLNYNNLEKNMKKNDFLNSQRLDIYNNFLKFGLPNKRIENWKYFDLKSNSRNFLEKEVQDASILIKDLENNKNKFYDLKSEDGNVQTSIVGTLNEFMAPEDVVLCAAGSLPGDLHRLWRSEIPKTYHMEYGYSCMGYEVAGGLGAKMAMEKGEVYIIVGDGSYLMLHSEILTALKEHVKINIVLLDNSGYQCIKNLQIAHGSAGFGNEFRFREESTGRLTGDFTAVDFKKYAEALGVKAFYAEDANQLSFSLEKARSETVSTLIEVKVLPGTMTGGYHSWWRVGVPEVSNCKATQESHLEMAREISKARAY